MQDMAQRKPRGDYRLYFLQIASAKGSIWESRRNNAYHFQILPARNKLPLALHKSGNRRAELH